MIWMISSWVLLVLAILVGARALFWDRPGFRGRAKLRCRKCWYDLTASPGDLRVEAIVCPECGKKHTSRRSMRKTRRHKRWVLVALVLLVGSYAAGVWPRVSAYNYSNGVLGAVPTPVLILSIPLLPDEPGTIVDRNSSPAAAIPYPQRPMAERIAHQLKIRLYKTKDTSALDHWLFMRIARREPPEVLTDPTAIRGEMYRYVFEAWARQRRLSYEDERWARSVHQLEIRHAEYAIQSEPSYAKIRIRRLLDRHRWRVRIHKTLYEIDRKVDWKTSAGFYELRPVEIRQYGWWDGAACIYDMIFLNNNVYFGVSPPNTFERSVSGTIYDGDPYADIWWPVGQIEENVEFKIAQYTRAGSVAEVTHTQDQWIIEDGVLWVDSYSGVDVITEPEKYIAWVRSRVKVSFDHDEDVPFGEGLPESLMLSVEDHALANTLAVDPFTFGGTVKVVIQTREGGRFEEAPAEHTMVVMEGEDAWWALREELDDQGLHVFEGKWKKLGLNPARGFERYEQGGVFSYGGISIASNDEFIDGYVEIRFGGMPSYRGGFRTLSDLDAERVLTAPVRIPLERSKGTNILNAVRSDTYRMGYKDLYTEAELSEIDRLHPSRTWSTR